MKKISDQLLEHLPEIAKQLQVAHGSVDDGQDAKLDEELLRDLGVALAAIADGQPAGKVFRQNERRKPKRTSGPYIALVYYFGRDCGKDIGHDDEAIALVRAAKLLHPPDSAFTIRKIAQQWRDFALAFFQKYPQTASQVVYGIYGTIFVPRSQLEMALQREGRLTPEMRATLDAIPTSSALTSVKVDGLREYLRRKSKRAHGPAVDEEFLASLPVARTAARTAPGVLAGTRGGMKVNQTPARRSGGSKMLPKSQRETRTKVAT